MGVLQASPNPSSEVYLKFLYPHLCHCYPNSGSWGDIAIVRKLFSAAEAEEKLEAASVVSISVELQKDKARTALCWWQQNDLNIISLR